MSSGVRMAQDADPPLDDYARHLIGVEKARAEKAEADAVRLAEALKGVYQHGQCECELDHYAAARKALRLHPEGLRD